MSQKKNAVENFVTNWIETEVKRTREIPKDFGGLEAELPQFRQKLADDGFRVSLRWLTIRAEQLFNIHVGIERIVNLKHDTQLLEAIRIIKADEVGKTIQLYRTIDQLLKFMGQELQALAHASGHKN